MIFYTLDKKIDDSFVCDRREKFSELLKKFYLKFPDYQNNNYYYVFGGVVVDEDKTLEELRINNSDKIQINENYLI